MTDLALTESWQNFEKTMGGRMVLDGTPEAIKAQYEGLVQVLMPHAPPPPEGVDSKDGNVDGVKYRLYTAKDAQGPQPIAIWTHGGKSVHRADGQLVINVHETTV